VSGVGSEVLGLGFQGFGVLGFWGWDPPVGVPEPRLPPVVVPAVELRVKG